jgi:galactokinase
MERTLFTPAEELSKFPFPSSSEDCVILHGFTKLPLAALSSVPNCSREKAAALATQYLVFPTQNSTVQTRAYARVGILGNPSDGYEGRTLSCTIDNFFATCTMTSSANFVFNSERYSTLGDLEKYIEYSSLPDDGTNLIVATTKVFIQAVQERRIILPPKPFHIQFDTTIPRQVGLAGSSAICTAVFRALCTWYGFPGTSNLDSDRFISFHSLRSIGTI